GKGLVADWMAYNGTDRMGKWLLSASYSGHKVTVNPIGQNGVVEAVKQSIPILPNSHSIIPDKSNKHVLAASLGADVVNQFGFDAKTGTLKSADPANMKVKDKNGPRHFRYSGDEKFVYLLNELAAVADGL